MEIKRQKFLHGKARARLKDQKLTECLLEKAQEKVKKLYCQIDDQKKLHVDTVRSMKQKIEELQQQS